KRGISPRGAGFSTRACRGANARMQRFLPDRCHGPRLPHAGGRRAPIRDGGRRAATPEGADMDSRFVPRLAEAVQRVIAGERTSLAADGPGGGPTLLAR